MTLVLTLIERLATMLLPVRSAGSLVLMVGYETWWVVALEPVETEV
jgi:hypothetical protein